MVRDIREQETGYEELPEIYANLKADHRSDWLCALQILEILYHTKQFPELEHEIRISLEHRALSEPEHKKLITDGLHVIENPVTQLITEEEDL